MLFGNRDFLNSIYGIYGSEYAEARGRLVETLLTFVFVLDNASVGPSSDGKCESPV
jgi:hypothetical protein